jgi:hypothetical protein
VPSVSSTPGSARFSWGPALPPDLKVIPRAQTVELTYNSRPNPQPRARGGFGVVCVCEPKTPGICSPFPNMTVDEILARVQSMARPLRRTPRRRRPNRLSPPVRVR